MLEGSLCRVLPVYINVQSVEMIIQGARYKNPGTV